MKANGAPDSKQVYLIASGGIKDDLKENGLNIFGEGPDVLPLLSDNEEEIAKVNLSARPDEVCAVVVSRDVHFNFKKLIKAANFLKNPQCLFLATNDNGMTTDRDGNIVIPDAGALAAAIQKATKREPTTMGKPHAYGLEYIKKGRDIDITRTVMICSSVMCDVPFGRKNGLCTLLILNGAAEREELEKMRDDHLQDYIPQYYATSISALLPTNK